MFKTAQLSLFFLSDSKTKKKYPEPRQWSPPNSSASIKASCSEQFVAVDLLDSLKRATLRIMLTAKGFIAAQLSAASWSQIRVEPELIEFQTSEFNLRFVSGDHIYIVHPATGTRIEIAPGLNYLIRETDHGQQTIIGDDISSSRRPQKNTAHAYE